MPEKNQNKNLRLQKKIEFNYFMKDNPIMSYFKT